MFCLFFYVGGSSFFFFNEIFNKNKKNTSEAPKFVKRQSFADSFNNKNEKKNILRPSASQIKKTLKKNCDTNGGIQQNDDAQCTNKRAKNKILSFHITRPSGRPKSSTTRPPPVRRAVRCVRTERIRTSVCSSSLPGTEDRFVVFCFVFAFSLFHRGLIAERESQA